MSRISEFGFENHPVRVITGDDGEPRWIARDVAEALGYTWDGHRIQHVPEEWRGLVSVTTLSGTQEMASLTEQGLYFFLGRSDKAGALPFQRWIAGKVLPSIRKTGGYSIAPAFKIPQTYSEALRLAADLQDVVGSQALQIEAAAPKVAFVDSFVEKNQTQPLRAVAKVLGVKEKDFVRVLIEKKVLYRLAGKLTPAQEHMEAGRFELKEVQSTRTDWAGPQMRFTTRGVEWVAHKVREWGITTEGKEA